MIFCHDKIYAKVWTVKHSEKYLDLRVTTSEKDQEGAYVNSSWFPRVIGHAFNTLKNTLKEGDKIVITKSKLTNESYKAEDGSFKSSFKFLILEAQIDAPQEQVEQAEVSESAEDKKEDSPW